MKMYFVIRIFIDLVNHIIISNFSIQLGIITHQGSVKNRVSYPCFYNLIQQHGPDNYKKSSPRGRDLWNT
jgi:hypothetical protein